MTPDAQQPEPAPKFCLVDMFHYDEGDMEREDIGICKGDTCNWCGRYTLRIHPHTPAPNNCEMKEIAIQHRIDEAARAATLKAEQTDNILAVLKKRYKGEMAILDYVEMIECEVMALAKQEKKP